MSRAGNGARNEAPVFHRRDRTKNTTLCLLAACLLLGLLTGVSRARASDAAPLAKLELEHESCLVFLGDSITHQCLYTQYVEDFFYTRFPSRRIRFHNAGVGGAQAWDALQRFDRDVADYQPKYVTVLLGMNDGRYRPFDQEIFDTYRNDMTKLVEKITETGATPILMTPTMFDARAARMNPRRRDPEGTQLYNSVLAYYGAWLREVAVEGGYGFVDMYSPLNNLTLMSRKENSQFTLIKDAVHPGPSGQLVMAYAVLDNLGMRAPLSTIRMQVRKQGLRATAKGGVVSDSQYQDGELRFSWRAQGLPFVVPEEAAQGAKLLKLGHRMSRESLTVSGLPEARYELSIDGEVVGQYSAAALARHIELQGNTKTPQHRQATKVVLLNKKRNSGPVRSLRGEWSLFQRFARLKRQLESDPENGELKGRFDEISQRLEGREQRIAQFEAQAKELENEIYALNQPPVRKYVLRRMTRNERQSNRMPGVPAPTGDRHIRPNSYLELVFSRSAGFEGGLTEGPAVAPDGSIYFSDIRRGKDKGVIHRFDPKTNETTIFAEDSAKSNGLIFTHDGSLLACEGADFGGRRVTRWDIATKQRVTVVDQFEGQRFNSPNDLCIDAAGRIYFSDPRYLGHEPCELEARAIYRIDPDGSVQEATRQIVKPNGLAISPDGRTLYAADHDNGTDKIDETQPAPPQGDMKIYAFRIEAGDGTLHDRRTLVDFGTTKGCDGMTVDEEGNVYLTVRDPSRPGILIVNPHGDEVAFIPTGPTNQSGETLVGLPSNVEFGIGPDRNLLYVTVDTSLCRIRLKVNGFHHQYRHETR